MTTVPECTGRCCDPVAMSAEQYAAMVATPGDFLDGAQIVAMLRPRDGTAGTFACANFEPVTRRCRIYDARPQVCAVYPSGGTCPHCGGDGLGT
jgi:Fe-S-cluster containining protein